MLIAQIQYWIMMTSIFFIVIEVWNIESTLKIHKQKKYKKGTNQIANLRK